MYRNLTGNRLKAATMLCQLQKTLRSNKKNFSICWSSRTISRISGQNGMKCSNSYQKYPNFQYAKRQFSLSTVSSIWLPWGGSNSEPTATPEVSPVLPPGTETTIAPEVVSSVDASQLVDPALPLTDVLTGAIVDPPFIELGLASGWWPQDFIQQIMEFVHLNTGLPWWSTIIMGTIIIRTLAIPLYIFTRKFTINNNNHSEEMQSLVKETQKYRYKDDVIRTRLATHKLNQFYKRTGTGPYKGLFANGSMTVLFITCVTSVRQMCAVPVPSFVEGGTLWFTDLSLPDPYYILPVLTGASIGLIINIAMRGGTMQRSWTGVLSKVQYVPVILMPLIFGSTSSGIYLYWLTTSMFSLCFQRVLLIPRVKEMLKFPNLKPVVAADNKGAVRRFKDWKEESFRQAEIKMQYKAVQRARKERKKEQKRALKDKPPITYTIGVDAIPAEQKKPDFEREWRPAKPKHFGLY